MIIIIMDNALLILLFCISRIANWSFKSAFNRLFSLFLIGGSMCLLFSQNIKNDLMYVFLISLILSFSIVRVSDNFILSILTGHLSMNLLVINKYSKYSYFKNKKEISEKLKEDFIIGIINASKYRSTIRFNTHSWFVNNVVLTEDIMPLFKIKAKEKKKVRIVLEVLCLFSLREALFNTCDTLTTSFKRRKGYFVTLKKWA